MAIKGQATQKVFSLGSTTEWTLRINGLLVSLSLVWLTLAFYRYTLYYRGFLSHDVQKYLLYIAIAYSLSALIFYFLAPLDKITLSKPVLTLSALQKIGKGIGSFVRTGPRDYTHPLVSITKEEKRALLFNLVKIFFIPLMISYLVGNYSDFRSSTSNLGNGGLWTQAGFNFLIFPLLFNLFLFIDTAFFAFGYLFESSFLTSKVRSVEPTVLGWSVALICYAPFNGLLGNYVSWYANDYVVGSRPAITFWLRLSSLIFMGIYASASVALGPKASNLTNRGIVGYGPYRIVRHPAYICKNTAWWITVIPVISFPAVLAMSFWSSIYFMRAITEERHLSADPDYIAYCAKVKYRFIPGLI